ncbi:hypothetical protein JCM9279_004676 [Rhodotorula babjevae]
MRGILSLLGSLALFHLIAAAPVSPQALETRAALCRNVARNAGQFSLPCATYANSLTCPSGLNGKKGGVVLLVHGTGSTGEETWANGPYIKLLPSAGPGFDVCWVTLPDRSLGDIQISSEYIAYLVEYLSSQSATKKVGLVTHSQGGLNAQWALNFWPSYRSLVSSFVALAPPFKGTIEGPPACLVTSLLGGCNPSVIQQSVASNFLDALNVQGDVALVPTTSIYTAYDDVIQPELLAPTSRLVNAKVVRIQDTCGPAYVVEHFIIPFASYPYYLALDALTNKGVADTARVLKSSCAWLVNDVLLDNFNRAPSILSEVVHDALAVLLGTKARKEPLLQPYVCKRGDVKSGCSS